MLGGIEAGGTKFICAVGESPERISARTIIPTGAPAETLPAVISYFKENGPIALLGVASFGPINLDMGSTEFGLLLNTPKPGWPGINYRDEFEEMNCPIALDTDVNGAAIAEHRYGAGIDCQTLVYVTVGTGIGCGVTKNGVAVTGAGNSEIGHIGVTVDRTIDAYAGCCPYHGDCVEGLASGPAIQDRWGAPLDKLPQENVELIGAYLAQLAHTLVLTHRPDRIIFGGGVSKTPSLIECIRTSTEQLLSGFIDTPPMDAFIVPPKLGDDAGVVGALMLAERARA